MTKGHKKKKMQAIRLRAGSTAKGALSAAEHDAHEEFDMKASKGGLPNQHALGLLGRMFKAVHEPFEPVGLSFFDKVMSLKVDNASKLLHNISWRDFFEKGGSFPKRGGRSINSEISNTKNPKNPNSEQQGRGRSKDRSSSSSSSSGKIVGNMYQNGNGKDKDDQYVRAHGQGYDMGGKSKNGGNSGNTSTSNYSNGNYSNEKEREREREKEKEDLSDPMQLTFSNLRNRIELLWRELKVSPADRRFCTYLRACLQSLIILLMLIVLIMLIMLIMLIEL